MRLNIDPSRINLETIVYSKFTAPFLCLVILTGFDLITKDIARTYWRMSGGIVVIDSILKLEYLEYYDSFFSIGSSLPPEWKQPLFILGTLVFLCAVSWAIVRHRFAETTLIAVALMAAGAIGNVGDRIFLGYVVDIACLFYSTIHWPQGNLADVYMYTGFLILLVRALWLYKRRRAVVA